jgi:2-octaprenyl-6-methoxyphenol hydroxylase
VIDKTIPPDFDVLIIGGGMVGASLALALRHSGLRLGVIEAVAYGSAQQPSYDDRTVALAYGSRRIFTAMQAWQRIEALGVTPIERIHVSDRGHFGVARLDAGEAGVEALGYVVENRVLGAALTGMMAAAENITLVCPAEMQAVEFTPGAARVTLVQAGRNRTVSTRLLVAADGGRSAVRTLLGIATQRVEYDQCAVVTNITPERAHAGTAYERFTASGPLALLPMSDNRCSVVWSLPPAEAARMLALSDGEFLRHLQAGFGDRLGEFVKVGARQSYPLALTRVAEHVRPRLALIGNAAHTLHPVAGQGFNLGLRDVAVLAQVVTEAQAAGADIGDLSVLRRYADWRRRDNLAVSTFTDGLVRVFSNAFPPLVAARNLGLLALDLVPPVKRSLLRRTMGLAGRLPLLARGLPLQP